MDKYIRGGTALLDGKLKRADLLIGDGKLIAASAGLRSSAAATVIDATGLVVAPAFCDLHVHLREPGFEQKETIETGTFAAARGGFTTVCAMPNLSPVPDCAENLEEQLARIARFSAVEVLPYGAITRGQKGAEVSDLEAMARFVAGFSDDGRGVQSDERMREAMTRARALGLPIAAHCEDESLLCGGSVSEGYAKAHGMAGISNESEWRQIERDLALVRETGCRYHICHLSTAEGVALIRGAKHEGLPVTCEVTPHHLLLCEDDITSDSGRFKMNPPLRSAADRDALLAGLLDGTVDCIATDHAPHAEAEKAGGLACSAFGVVGLETAYAASLTATDGRVPHETVLHALGLGARGVLGRTWRTGDWVLLDPAAQETVKPEHFISMGRSTPFEGRSLSGQVLMTLRDGRIIWRHPAADRRMNV